MDTSQLVEAAAVAASGLGSLWRRGCVAAVCACVCECVRALTSDLTVQSIFMAAIAWHHKATMTRPPYTQTRTHTNTHKPHPLLLHIQTPHHIHQTGHNAPNRHEMCTRNRCRDVNMVNGPYMEAGYKQDMADMLNIHTPVRKQVFISARGFRSVIVACKSCGVLVHESVQVPRVNSKSMI